MAYSVVDVSLWQALEEETLGTKEKVWLSNQAEELWLFKYPRPGTGEHWAEKVVAEIAELVGVPHAIVDLGVRNGDTGSISRDFTRERKHSVLALGNLLLSIADSSYRLHAAKPIEHTVDRVLDLLAKVRVIRPPAACSGMPDIRLAADAFVGYLMLDALVVNTDRHHENWGILVRRVDQESEVELAPSFDHASSLGREISDDERELRLAGRDRGRTVERYCGRGRSPLFAEGRALTVRGTFSRAREPRPESASSWLGRLRNVPEAEFAQILDEVSDEVMSDAAKRFAVAMLECNRLFLLGDT